MRSHDVYKALIKVPNRFALCQTTSKGARLLHAAQSRPEDTISRVLENLGATRAVAPASK
jgi:hypothetical protein